MTYDGDSQLAQDYIPQDLELSESRPLRTTSRMRTRLPGARNLLDMSLGD